MTAAAGARQDAAFDVRHLEKHETLYFVYRINRDDARMAELGCGLGLPEEAGSNLGAKR